MSVIESTLGKNDELIVRFIKESKLINNFIVDFQKEVVESHKTIWNELYSLRQILAKPSQTPKNKKQSMFGIDSERNNSRRSSISSQTFDSNKHEDVSRSTSDLRPSTTKASYSNNKTIEFEDAQRAEAKNYESATTPHHPKSKSDIPALF